MEGQKEAIQKQEEKLERDRQKLIDFQQAGIADTNLQDNIYCQEKPSKFRKQFESENVVTEDDKFVKQWLTREIYEEYSRKDDLERVEMIENLILEDKINIAHTYIQKITFRQSDKDDY
ncbi:UNKNOWN [Stylonychia lemnae]|uniref:Uncharacterized protein n=1 Tax=Stylonychia lemnae TaxID=5949 RepID=A0A078AVN3_STYLE|nr:UNKNOWN [Stylonychia lemnae]|eukprot:CDW85322.1 UNKNOWN [Stylonychia lemnae]